ncbi:MAG: radical SAM protein [Calditrichia bacterium]
MKILQKFSFYRYLFSYPKAVNLLLNLTSFYISKWTGRYFVWGSPYSFFIEPTNHCNLGCTECPVGTQILKRPQGYMELPKFNQIIDEISSHAWYLLLYFQGEPTMNRELVQMVDYSWQKKIYSVISTNGSRLASREFSRSLAASNLGELVISLDGATEQTYRIYRRKGMFERVVKGIEIFLEERNRLNKPFPRVVIQFLVMRHNEHEITAIKRLGKKLGVDKVVFKSPQIYDFEEAESILPKNPKFRRYQKMEEGYRLKGSYSGYCRKLWIGSVITQDGRVIPCCFDKEGEYSLGEMPQENFFKIWRSEKYHGFRRRVVSDRGKIPICRNCSEGLKTFYN